MRAVTRAQNAVNRNMSRNNTSGYKGVNRYRGGWVARVYRNGTRVSLGVFATPEEASAAYDRAMTEMHGEYACTNSMLREETLQ